MQAAEKAHFEGKDPVVDKIYRRMLAQMKPFGKIGIDPKKTSIHLINRFAFAGVYTRNNYINLEFHLAYKVNSVRIAKVKQASANRYHHTVKLTSEKDVNRELISWLQAAYELKA